MEKEIPLGGKILIFFFRIFFSEFFFSEFFFRILFFSPFFFNNLRLDAMNERRKRRDRLLAGMAKLWKDIDN